jgi:hypothetical protein
MNARTDNATLEQADPLSPEALDMTPAAEAAGTALIVTPALTVDEITAGTYTLTADERAELKIDEVLDAAPRDAEGNAITGITPFVPDMTAEALAMLVQRFTGAQFDVKNPEGMKAAKKTVKSLTSLKTAAEADYKKWNDPIQAMLGRAREQRDHIINTVVALRDPIAEQVDAEQKEIDRKKNEAARAESERITAHTAAVAELRRLPEAFALADAQSIADEIAAISKHDYLTGIRDWQEFMPQAADAQTAVLTALEVHLTNARAREQLAQLQAEQAAKDAERERAAAAERAERERVDGLKERITNIQTLPTVCIGMGVKEIESTLARLAKTTADMFAEFAGEAQTAIDNARANLETMLQGAKDAEELAEFRAAKARKAQEEENARLAAERAEQERKDAEARAEQERQEAAARAAREAQQARERAAAEQAERTRAIAQSLLDLVRRARPYVAAAEQTLEGDLLIEEIDAALNAIDGE